MANELLVDGALPVQDADLPRPKKPDRGTTITFRNKAPLFIQFPKQEEFPTLTAGAPAMGQVITGIPHETNAEFDVVLENLLMENQAKKQAEQDEAALQIIRDPGLSPEERAERARSMPPAGKPSPGMLFTDTINVQDDISKQLIADEVDVNLLRQVNEKAQISLIDNDPEITFNEFVNKPRDEVPVIYSAMADELLAERAIDQQTHNELKNNTPKSLDELIVGVQRGLLFSSPRPVTDAESVEWTGVWKELVDMDGDFVSDQFVSSMNQQYGPHWKWRWGTFFAREIGVDAAALWYASTVRGVKRLAFPGSGAALSKRALGVGVRASIVATAGTSAEGLIQTLAGQGKDFDLSSEFFWRAMGELGGEAVMKGGSLLVPPLKSLFEAVRGTKAIVDVQRKMLTQKDMARIRNVMEYEPGSFRTVLLASIRGEATEYKRLADQVVQGVADPSVLQLKRAQLAELVGVPETTMEIWLALSPTIFTKQVLGVIGGKELADLKNVDNIGRSAQYYELKTGIETNRTLLADLLGQKETVADQILDLQTNPRNLVDTPEGKQRLKVLRSERAQINKDIAEMRSTTKEAEEFIEELDKAPLTTGNQLADKVITGDAVGFRLMGEVTQRQQAVSDIFLSYINKDGSYQFRPPDRVTGDLNFVQKTKKFFRLNEPDTYPNPGLMKDYFDAFNDAAQLNKEWTQIIRRSLDGVGTKGQERVFNALQAGNDAEKVFDVDELISRGLSTKEVDAYFAVRKGLDFSHIVNDKVMTARLREKGVKMYQGQPVNVFRAHQLLSEEQKESGMVVVQKAVDASSKPKEPFLVINEAELGELTSVIPSHTGYVPRVYANANFAVSVIDTRTGQVSRVAAVSRQSKAVDIARKHQAESGPESVVVYHRWDENTGTMRMGVPKASIKAYDLLDNASADQLKEALEASGIEGADQIIAVFNKQDLGDLRNRFTGQRQDLPIEGRLAPTPQAIADYFSATARNQSMGYWRDWAVKSFKDEYSNVIDPRFHWSDPRAIPSDVGMAKVNNKAARDFISDETIQAKLNDAQFMQRALKRAVFGTTGAERKVSKWLDNKIANMVSSSSAVNRATGKVLDRLTSFDVLKVARGIGSYPKLMAGNVAQVIVQASQVAATVGAHPIYASGAAKELVQITAAAAARALKPNLPVGRETEQTLNALRKSGYLSDVRTSDLANWIQTPDNPLPSGFGRIIQGGKTALETASTGPFRLGEATNRAMAFLTIRREFTDLAKKGKLKGLNGETFTGKIDDDEFLRLVTNKAKIFALNMGKAGQLELLSGLGSVVFQFKQVMPKFTNIFETKELSSSEKIRAGIGMLGMWGPTAIPFLPDLFIGADAVGRLFENDPSQTEAFTQGLLGLREWNKTIVDYAANATPAEIRAMGYNEEFYDRLIRRGFLNAATEGDLDITNRVALGKFVSESMENMSWQDAVVSVAVVTDIYDAAKKSGVLNVANIFTYTNALGLYAAEQTGAVPQGSYDEFITKLRLSNRDTGLIGEAITGDDDVTENALIRLGSEFGQAFSYLGSMTRFVDASVATNQAEATPELVDQTVPYFKTSTNRPTIPVEKRLLYQFLFGVTPGPIVEELEKQKLDTLYRTRYNDYIDSQIDKYASTTDYNKQMRIFSETVQDIDALEHILNGWEMEEVLPPNWRSTIFNKFSTALIRTQMPTETQKVRTR